MARLGRSILDVGTSRVAHCRPKFFGQLCVLDRPTSDGGGEGLDFPTILLRVASGPLISQAGKRLCSPILSMHLPQGCAMLSAWKVSVDAEPPPVQEIPLRLDQAEPTKQAPQNCGRNLQSGSLLVMWALQGEASSSGSTMAQQGSRE